MKIKLLILPLVAIVVAAGSCVKNPETPQRTVRDPVPAR